MKKMHLLLIGVLTIASFGCSQAPKIAPEEQFKTSFARIQYETFTQTAFEGVYEVYDGRQLLYYLPKADVILAGNMISKDGKNLTQESLSKKMAVKLGKLPLDKALKIGSGPKTVVKFTDPNCPYCRRGFEYLDRIKKDVTVYVFFLPLSADSDRKITHILCASDPAAAYEDVFRGKFDHNAKLNLCESAQVQNTRQAHRDLAAEIGIRATPLFYISGEVVPGFDEKAIEKLLAN